MRRVALGPVPATMLSGVDDGALRAYLALPDAEALGSWLARRA